MDSNNVRNFSIGWSVDPENPNAGIVISHLGSRVSQLLISKMEAVQLRDHLGVFLSSQGISRITTTGFRGPEKLENLKEAISVCDALIWAAVERMADEDTHSFFPGKIDGYCRDMKALRELLAERS